MTRMNLRANGWALIAALSLLSAGHAFAQSQMVFAFVGVKSVNDTASQTDVRVLENRLTAYLVEVADRKDYGLIIPNNREQVLKEIDFSGTNPVSRLQAGKLVAASGLVAGALNRTGTRFSLELALVSVDNGDTLSQVSEDYDGYDRLLNASRSLVYGLFQITAPGIASEGGQSARGSGTGSGSTAPHAGSGAGGSYVRHPTLSMIAGTWKPDRGITSVTIREDGTAVATIDPNNVMALSVAIDGDSVVVRQDEPNAPKMYISLYPYSIAVQIVQLARPMRWTFRLDSSGNLLRGVKDGSMFRIEHGSIVSVDNTYRRPATWERMQ